MLVKVLNFGTNWWSRLGYGVNDPCQRTRHAAYYNSTGVRCGRRVRRHWVVPGLIRFNGVGDFKPDSLDSLLGEIFLCSDLDFLFGGNRLLFIKKMPRNTLPDLHLIVLSGELHGQIDLGASDWRLRQTAVIAASQLRDMQEVMLLMRTGDWVKTTFGFWQLSAPASADSTPALELRAEPAAFETGAKCGTKKARLL